MAIGLGGVAKGYAVDRACGVLRRAGLEHFVVNSGGDLRAFGTHEGQLWRAAIRDPRGPGNVAVLPLSNLALATSGDYERYAVIDGRRYCHIIDPRTGRPADGCRSVSVLAPTAALADALATAVFVLGPERGLALAEGWDGVECFIIDAEGGKHLSAGLRGGR